MINYINGGLYGVQRSKRKRILIMELFYKVSDKELLKIRNEIFLDKGISALKKNGFEQSPFKTSWFGQYDRNISGYSYELCRLSQKSRLEIIEVFILKGEKRIQIILNTFELQPKLKSLTELQGLEGIKYGLPPNSLTKMELRWNDIKGMPLLDYNYMFGGHKIRSYHTKVGFTQRVKELGNRIEKDLTNINDFVKRWHKLHKPNVVDWEGNKI